MKLRQNLYIDHDLVNVLERLVKARGRTKSRLVNDAIREWIASQGSKEASEHLKPRLDLMSGQIEKARGDLNVLLESLALFVRYQLTVTAPLPEADRASIAVGNERFERFIGQLGRQLASGQRSLGELSGHPK